MFRTFKSLVVFFILLPLTLLVINGCATTQENSKPLFNSTVIEKNFVDNLKKEPIWDGVYVKSTNGLYYQMKPVFKVVPEKRVSALTREPYFAFTLEKEKVNVIPYNYFKGFYFKGNDAIKDIEIHAIKKSVSVFNILASNTLTFKLTMSSMKDNLFNEKFRCISYPSSLYCEPQDKKDFINWLKDYSKIDNAGCFLMKTGYEKSSAMKEYIICIK